MTYRIGADIGGTFTDLVMTGPGGGRWTRKVLSTPDDYSRAIIDGVRDMLAEAGVPMSRYALACTLAQPAMTSLIVGVKKLEQVQEAVAAADVVIPPEHLPKLDAICPPPWRQPDPIRG
jgi:aryl-alcohol dehydrogenase-like predicted oxidoreductase